MTRLNITLPAEIVKKLAEKPNKSHFIAMILQEEFKREMKEKTEQLMKEGYKATFLEDKNINTEWDTAGLKKWE